MFALYSVILYVLYITQVYSAAVLRDEISPQTLESSYSPLSRRGGAGDTNAGANATIGSLELGLLGKSSRWHPFEWTDGSSNFKIVVDIYNCISMEQRTVIGDWTFINGTVGQDVNWRTMEADDYDLQHSQAGNLLALRIKHLLQNARDLRDELDHYQMGAKSLPAVFHDELRKLLWSSREPKTAAQWFVYLTPPALGGSLAGWITASAFESANKTEIWSQNGVKPFQLETWAVVASSVLTTVLIAKIQDWVNARDLTFGDIRVVQVFIAWVRRAMRYLCTFGTVYSTEYGGDNGQSLLQEMIDNPSTQPGTDSVPTQDLGGPQFSEIFARDHIGLNAADLAADTMTNVEALRQRLGGGGDCQNTVVEMGDHGR